MSLEKNSSRPSPIGGIASRVLTIPVMALALAVVYLTLRAHTVEEPALIADVSAELTATPDATSVAPGARRVPDSWPEPAYDAAISAHETLDPVGAGRAP